MNRWILRLAAVAAAFTLIVSLLPSLFLASAKKVVTECSGKEVVLEPAQSYNDYIISHRDKARPDSIVNIDTSNLVGDGYEVEENFKGRKGKTVLTPDSGDVKWRFEIANGGMYCIKIEYYPTEGKGSAIIRALKIDGSLPFNEARNLSFSRLWSDKKSEDGRAIQTDVKGNDIRPTQVEAPRWITTPLMEPSGFLLTPLEFYFSEGEHILSLTAVQEPMAIHSITLYKYKPPASVNDVRDEYKQKNYTAPDAEPIKLQAETPDLKTDSMIMPVSDRSSPAIEPSDPAKYKLNTIGSTGWTQPWSSISYDFVIEKAGLYQICLKGKQNFVSGANSYRSVLIDGEIPYAQLSSVCFHYSRKWQMNILGDDNGAFPVYLDEGTHTITLRNTLGDMAAVMLESTEILGDLNSIYADILMLTGPTPDVNRDYQFKTVIPDTLKEIAAAADRLKKLHAKMVKEALASGANMQIAVQLYTQLEAMAENPNRIAEKLTAFQGYIDSFGSWINSAKLQPLSLDYILISPSGSEVPEADMDFFSHLKYQVGSFIASFFVDYNSITYGSSEKEVNVWVGSGMTGGRDQAQIIKTMSEDFFTPQTGISVSLKLVSMGALLPATLAGKGPDVALSLSSGEAANYAFRGAAVDMSAFEGFDEVAKRFSPSALVPLTFEGMVYGLPETQSFMMLFYRKDILLQLGINKLPDTWDEVIAILPILQKKQLEFGLPSATGTGASAFAMYNLFLMQHGGNLYSGDGKKTLIDSDASVDAFTFHTNLYTQYQLSPALDFLNRFRRGTAPIGIADYTFYNSLSVFAPELNGLWDFTKVPSVRNEDGTVNRSVPGGVSACIILQKALHPDEAWEFVKWWTDAPAQVAFGRQLESIMGTAARYPTANLEAIYQIPWSTESFQSLLEQWETVEGIPEVPGGYFTPRYIDFAFRDVVLQGKLPGDTLLNSAKSINNEIYQKRLEFNLEN